MKKLFFVLGTIFPLYVFAAIYSYVCPKTYQTVMLKFTTAQVAQACGKPTTVTSQQQMQTKPVQLQQWVYTTSGANPGQFTPQLLITFDANEQVSQISVTNQTNINTFPCYSMGRIQVGSTSQQVHLQCGAPSYVNNLQQGINTPVSVTTWVYNFGAFKPEMIFTFENDQLTEIRMGQIVK